MELKQRHNNVISNGVIGEQSGFKIAMNAKMFRTLSDTLYEDKIGSLVREISCNAADAHIMAGTPDLPIEIHLPNALEPWFSVKDNGVGMSDADIRMVYTTYGESTKDSSNDQVGAFGLGSKTPFAYTDQFTVTSIHNGMQRTYVAVINDDGMPVLNMQDERETDNHPGLQVTMSVSTEDFYKFDEAVIKQLRFFKVKPILTNNMKNVEFADLDNEDFIHVQNDLVTLYNSNIGYHRPLSGLWIVQGGVGYPLNLHRLGSIPRETMEFADALHTNGAYMEFPIGQIAVTASREGVSYEEDTCTVIVKRIEDIAKFICDQAMTEIRQEKCVWNRVAEYNNQIDVVQKAIRNLPDFDSIFPGVSVDRGNMTIDSGRLTDMGFRAVYMVKYNYTSRATGSYGTATRLRRKVVGDRSSFYGNYTELFPRKDTIVFIRDTNKKPVARLKLFAEANDYPDTLVIEGATSSLTADDIKKVAKTLGFPAASIRKVSDLPAPKVTRSGQRADRRPRAYQFESVCKSFSSSKDWIPVYDLDDLDEAVYVPMNRHYISFNENLFLLLHAYNENKFDMPIIAVNGQTEKRILDGKIGDGFITVEEAVKPLHEKIEKLLPIFRARAKYAAFLSVIKRNHTVNQVMEKTGRLGVFSVEAVEKRHQQLSHRLEGWDFLTKTNRVNYHVETEIGQEAAGERVKKFFDKYPMLKYLNSYHDDEKFDEVIKYIELVDRGA